MTYYHEATVKGRGAFPLDMLRYDCCFPAQSFDVEVISATQKHATTWECKVGKVSTLKANPFTVARWNSFGCGIENIQTRRL